MKDFEWHDLLKREEAAAYLRISLRKLDSIPASVLPRIKYGHRTVRIERRALDAYLDACRVRVA